LLTFKNIYKKEQKFFSET